MSELVEKAVADCLGTPKVDWDKLKPVACFVVLWSRLEAVLDYHISLRKLRDKANLAASSESFDRRNYEPHIDYFRKRYHERPELLTTLFGTGSWRDKAVENKVKQLMSNMTLEPHDFLEASLMIPYRIRNNLFHGSKSTYELTRQSELFEQVNHILCHFHADIIESMN